MPRVRIRRPAFPALSALALLCGLVSSVFAVDPWPGETWANATDLTALNPTGWNSNLSGAYWNPVTRKLWVANNSGTFSRIRENGSGGFALDATYTDDADLEGITQADPSADRVYLIVERDNQIREYVASTGVLNRTWNLDSYVGGMLDDNEGVEGIAFIPDAWLAKSGFRDSSGALYPQSIHGANGLGGIMLVAVQDGGRTTAGYVYAVDLRNDGTWTRVGRYKTSRNESADLAFDASIGRLYILHNTGGNVLEVTDLTSTAFNADRKFTTLREIQVPSSSNIEGVAVAPALNADKTTGDGWVFFTDDNNAQGALRRFRQLPSTLVAQTGDGQSATVSTAVAVPPEALVRDAFGNPLPGFVVTFAVTGGGGSVTGGNAIADSLGIARVGSWILGASPGANTLSASGAGLAGSPVAYAATGLESTAIRAPAASATSARPKGATPRLPSLQWLLGRTGRR